MNPYIYIALASMSPILELRGAIPLGLGLRLDLYWMMFIAIAANMLTIPVMFILLKVSRFRVFVLRIVGERTASKIAQHGRRLEFWGELALIPLVAIPVPLSGAYTGVFVAETLGLNRFRSGLTIAIGVCIAAAVVLVVSKGLVRLW